MIEVLASIALLGLLLAATLVAIGRHTKQVRTAQYRLEALEVANVLLRTWLVENGGKLPAASGPVATHPGWYWRVIGKPESRLTNFDAHLGQVDILGDLKGQSEQVLASLEFVSTSPVTAAYRKQELP